MNISPVSEARGAAGPASSSGGNAEPALSSDFQTFLRMLTAQARYQDPMEPIDSSQYAAQLAQFSMVEQQVQTNDLLTALYGAGETGSMSTLASWVGMEARALAPAHFNGAPITISPNPASLSDEVYLVVHDESGKEVQRIGLPVSAESYEWQGVDEDGAPLPEGIYEFTVESYAEGEQILAEPAEVYARVREAQVSGGETILILSGGMAIPASSVTALRSPEAGTAPNAGSQGQA